MEPHRICLPIVALLTAASARADVFMGMSVNKAWEQIDATRLNFLGGELDLFLRDGLITIDSSCVTQPQLFPFSPSDIPPCPLGSTAFIAAGDVDRDGRRDDNQYWSVLSVVPALAVEPFRPELCQLYSAPPSKLPRPLQNFRDDGVLTFYNTNQADMRQYDQSRYELIRNYGSVQQRETVTATGTIVADGTVFVFVTIEGVALPAIPVTVEENNTPMEWAARVAAALLQVREITDLYTITVGGFLNNEITLTETVANGNDSTLNIAISNPPFPAPIVNFSLPITSSVNTQVGVFIPGPASLSLMNDELVTGTYTFTFPRLTYPDLTPVAIPINLTPNIEALGSNPRAKRNGFRFTSGVWNEGAMQLDPRLIGKLKWTGNERSVIRPGDQFFFSIESGGGVAFPPTGNPVILPNPTVKTYNLPPFFFEVGDEGTINLNYRRFLASNGVAFDTSSRDFRARVRFVDTYGGFSALAFPLGTPNRISKPDADADGDGFSNGTEFAFEFPTAELVDSLDPIPDNGNQSDAGLLGFGLPAANDPAPNRPVIAADPPGSFPKIQIPVTELDVDNHIVFKVSKRPFTGSTLKYTFQILDTSKKKPKFKNLKTGSAWTVTTVTETETLIINGVEMQLPHDYVILRSTTPVANPADPLPEFNVKFTFQKL